MVAVQVVVALVVEMALMELLAQPTLVVEQAVEAVVAEHLTEPTAAQALSSLLILPNILTSQSQAV
jgi:hypothetical protein